MRIEPALLRQTKQNWLKLIPGLFISAVSLVIIFYFIDIDRFLQAIKLADYRFILLLFGISLLWLIVRSIVWRTLLMEQAPLNQVFLTLNEGYLLNNILPFRLGELGRAFLLGKKAKLDFWQVFSTILIERILDVGFAAGILLISIPVVIGTGYARQAAILTSAIVLSGLLMLYLAARNQAWVLSLFEKLKSRFKFIDRIVKPHHLTAFFIGLSALTDMHRFLRTIAWISLNWGLAVVQFFVLIKAYFSSAQILWAAFTLSVMALGIAAPSSPGAFGVMEISIVGALAAFGLDPSASLAAALTAHLSNYLITGVIGAFALTRDGLSLTGLYRDVSKIKTEQQEPPD